MPKSEDVAIQILKAQRDALVSHLARLNEILASYEQLPQPFKRKSLTEDVFPVELRDMLEFRREGEQVLIKPKSFLGSDNFAKISAIVRDNLGGKYYSAGKDSHFRVPFQKPPDMTDFDGKEFSDHRWKGKAKDRERKIYYDGSLAWGWDLPSEFSEKALYHAKQGFQLGEYFIGYNFERNLVQTQKRR